MDKYTAKLLEDALNLLELIFCFCGISYLVWWHNFSPWWYLLLLFTGGYTLMEDKK